MAPYIHNNNDNTNNHNYTHKSKTCPRKNTPHYENVPQQVGQSPTISSKSKQQDLTKKEGPGLAVGVLDLWLGFGDLLEDIFITSLLSGSSLIAWILNL